MKGKIEEILIKTGTGEITIDIATQQILDLFGFNNNEVAVCTCENSEKEKDSLVPVYCHNCKAQVVSISLNGFENIKERVELREKFKKEIGDNWENSQNEPDIDYVLWLESKLFTKPGVFNL